MAVAPLETVLSAIASVRGFDELGDIIVETCARVFDAEVCTIWRRYTDDNGQPRLRLMAASAKAPQTIAAEVTYALDESDTEGKRADGVTAYVAQTRRDVHVSSFRQLREEYGFCWKGRMDPTQWDGKPQTEFRSLFSIPLLLGNAVVGVMKLENKRGSNEGFPQLDRTALKAVAPYIALTVHNYSLLEPHDERLIQVPARMVESLLQPFEAQQLVSEIVKTVATSLNAEICSLWLVDPTGRELRLADGYGFDTAARAKQTYPLCSPEAPDGEIAGITTWVAVRKRPFWANSWPELKTHPSWSGKWDQAMWSKGERYFRCLYALPLIREGNLVGVLKVENRKDAAFFTSSDRALCGVMASLIVLVLDLGQRLRAGVISDLAHLIRSPIGQVSMNLAGLEAEIKRLGETGKFRHDRAQNYVDFIKKALLAVTVTSRTLAAFAKRSVIGPPAPLTLVSIADLAEARVKEVTPLLYGGITIEIDLPTDRATTAVPLDVTERTRLGIVIDNVLHNAIKYSKEGGKITVSVRRTDHTALLRIQDRGAGISPEDLPRIFESGFSRRASGHPEGTGMGLTTVKDILDRLGWKTDVRSVAGAGTTFDILVPFPETEEVQA